METALSYQYSPYERKRVEDNRKRMVIGTPQQVKEQLLELAGAYGTDEIMAVTITHDFQDRLDSYRLLAEAFHQSI